MLISKNATKQQKILLFVYKLVLIEVISSIQINIKIKLRTLGARRLFSSHKKKRKKDRERGRGKREQERKRGMETLQSF